MNESLLAQVVSCPRIPSLPASAIKVIELCRRDDVSIQEISSAISRDPALTVKILTTVNSSFYSLAHRVTTIRHAVVLLGINTVRTLALGFTLVSALKDSAGESFDPGLIWQHSLYSAMTTRTIAQKIKHEHFEEAFIGALLQNLGVLAMIQTLGEKYIDLLKKMGTDFRRLSELERQKLDLDHAIVGEAMVKQWNLPPEIVALIRYHEQPELASENNKKLIQTVALGNTAACTFFEGDTQELVKEYLTNASEWFGFEHQEAMDILEVTAESASHMSQMFEIPEGKTVDVNTILREANEAMIHLTLKCQMQVTEMEVKTAQLEEKVTKDSLTGISNRGSFDEYFEHAFETAQSDGSALTLIMMDIDKFKGINDRYGHVAGDKVLMSVAKSLAKSVRRADMLLARYGGEEFVVVSPGLTSENAAKVAERFRASVADTWVIIDEDTELQVTTSFGVVTLNSDHKFSSPEQMIKLADCALYRAKSGGRNKVCIYDPSLDFIGGTGKMETDSAA